MIHISFSSKCCAWVIRCRFKLPYNTTPLGLPLGQHILIKGVTSEGEDVLKPYTPVTHLEQRGYVDFVIKVARLHVLVSLC